MTPRPATSIAHSPGSGTAATENWFPRRKWLTEAPDSAAEGTLASG